MQINTAEQIILIEPHKLPLRPWMPKQWRQAVSGQRISLVIPDPVKRRCKKPAPLTPSELSIKHRRMPTADDRSPASAFNFVWAISDNFTSGKGKAESINPTSTGSAMSAPLMQRQASLSLTMLL